MPRPNKLQSEQEHHKQAYEIYYGLGPKRTYRDVARQLNVSISSIKQAARSFGWSARIQERDASVARQAADQVIGSAVADATRKRKLVEMALMRVAKAIASGQVKIQVSDLDRLLRLQTFLDGGRAELTLEMIQSRPVIEVASFFWEWFTSCGDDDRTAILEWFRKRETAHPSSVYRLSSDPLTDSVQGQ